MGNKITLSEQIYQELYEDITEQRFICGQKLTLKELKERFGVSQTPIREALTRLTEDGLITYYSNLGVTVTTFTEADIRELFQCISEFDALAILFCRNTFTHAPLLFELEKIVETGNSLYAENRIDEWRRYSNEAHLVFYRHAQNSYLYSSARRLHAKIEVLSNLYYYDDPVHVENINEGHNAILEAIRKNDFEEAADTMRLHLQFNMVYAINSYREFQQKLEKESL
ncbi:MAG: GntR family transcriptional regulator [Emergencia sp.]